MTLRVSFASCDTLCAPSLTQPVRFMGRTPGALDSINLTDQHKSVGSCLCESTRCFVPWPCVSGDNIVATRNARCVVKNMQFLTHRV